MKMLSMKAPPCSIFQAPGYWGCRCRFQLQISHVAGQGDSVADQLSQLSRGRIPDYLPESHKRSPDVGGLLRAP